MTAPRAWTLSGGMFREGADVPVTDRGFRYGMSVFETLAVCRGRKFFLEEHLQRLQRACAAAEFSFPADLAVALAALTCDDGMLRIYVTAGDGGFSHPAEAVRTYALCDSMTFPPADAHFRIGVIYDEGNTIKQDYAEAMRWYTLVADKGHVDAQINLGVMYDRGWGVEPNFLGSSGNRVGKKSDKNA